MAPRSAELIALVMHEQTGIFVVLPHHKALQLTRKSSDFDSGIRILQLINIIDSPGYT